MVLSMDRWVGKIAIVTGASAGIGEAISERLVEKGMLVVGVARRKDRLEDIAKRMSGKKGQFYAVQGDVSKENDILNVFKWTTQNLGPVHVLVNNAAVVCKSTLQDGKTEDWLETINVNVVGLFMATREALKDMIQNNTDGHIFNINSVVGHHVLPIPKNEIYTATKHAVTAITESMRQEVGVQKKKIKFTSISPGAVRTEMIAGVLDRVGGSQFLHKDMTMLEADDIADAIEYALSTPPHVQVHELMIRPTGEVF